MKHKTFSNKNDLNAAEARARENNRHRNATQDIKAMGLKPTT